jgi:hypothetical protein
MGWTLGYLPPKEPVLLNNYFLAVGKALCLASNFEHNCRFVLQTITLVEAVRAGTDYDAARDLVKELDDKVKMLGGIILKFGNNSAFSPADIDVLRAAKDSRNYIAHESAGMGTLSGVRTKFIEDQFGRLLSHVEILAKGDNLVSKWCYEICEKEPAPSEIQENYVRMIREWVEKRTWEWDIEITDTSQ